MLGFALEYLGNEKQAKSAGQAAEAQLAMARETRDMTIAEGKRQEELANRLARASPQEMMSLDRMLSGAMAQLADREKMIAAIDPALMEASQQVLSLLRGDEAGMTQVMNQQRQRQRQQLVNQLRAQYGPGAESSSVGRRALDEFDSQTAMVTQQAQSQALGQAFGIASSAPGLTDRSNALQGLLGTASGFGAITQRQLGAQQIAGGQLMAGLSGTAGPMISNAGAPYVQAGLQGQSMAKFGSQINDFGSSLLGLGGGGKG
jgi:hypothetical protein